MLESSSANPFAATALTPEPGVAEQWLRLFAQFAREERRVSASTLEAYALDMAMLSRWAAGQRKDLLGLTTGDLTRYITQHREQGSHPSTLARHLSSYRCFYAFVMSQGALAINPAAAVLVPQVIRQEARRVPDDVLRALLRPPALRYPSPVSAYRARRDHTIVCMLYGTSLGISDIRLLCWRQIDEQWQVIRVPLRNGEVRSFVFDGTLLAGLKALRSLAANTGLDDVDNPYCFPTASGLPMTRQAFCHVVRKWARQRGRVEAVTPSALRQAGRVYQGQRRRLRPA